MGHVSAEIGPARQTQAQNPGIRIERELAFHLHVAAVAVGEECLHPLGNPLDRTANFLAAISTSACSTTTVAFIPKPPPTSV